MPMSLEERFKAFLRQMPAVEEMDDSAISMQFKENKISDYLLFDRKIILELKTLKNDTSNKVEEEMNKHQERADYPLFYGEQSLEKVLAHLSDGKKIHAQIFKKITRSIEDDVRHADKQIESTRKVLNLSESVGVLALLNENIDILSPQIIVRRVSQLLCYKKPNNLVGYKNVQFVWLISESHSCKLDNGAAALGSIRLEGPTAIENNWFSTAFNRLEAGWAKFNNMPYIQTNKAIKEIVFCSNVSENINDTADRRETRSDCWRKNYRESPYLRKLSDDQVYEFGEKVIKEMLPHFLKGGRKLPQNQVGSLIKSWTDFLEEVNFRGLDLKKIKRGQVFL